MISSKNLAEAIYKISLDESLSTDKVVEKSMDYIKENKLEALLPKTINHLEEKAKKQKIWNTFSIISGKKINEDIVNDIKKRLDANNATNTLNTVDEDLIGGFVATYKGTIYDASLKNQLQLLRTVLTK